MYKDNRLREGPEYSWMIVTQCGEKRVHGEEMHVDEHEVRESQDRKGNHDCLVHHCTPGIWHHE